MFIFASESESEIRKAMCAKVRAEWLTSLKSRPELETVKNNSHRKEVPLKPQVRAFKRIHEVNERMPLIDIVSRGLQQKNCVKLTTHIWFIVESRQETHQEMR